METSVRDDFKLGHQDSIRNFRNDTKLYFNTLDEKTVRDLTIDYSLSETKTTILRHFVPFTSSRRGAFPAVQKFFRDDSRSRDRLQPKT